MGAIKGGVQGSSKETISHGIQSPKGSSFSRQPNPDNKDATYKFDKQSGKGPSGNGQTQSQGRGSHAKNENRAGANGYGHAKGHVSSFGSKPTGSMKSGLSGQKKGHGA